MKIFYILVATITLVACSNKEDEAERQDKNFYAVPGPSKVKPDMSWLDRDLSTPNKKNNGEKPDSQNVNSGK